MESFLRALANDLRSLATSLDNSAPNDYPQFRPERVIEDLVQLNADVDTDIDAAVLDSLQEVAHQLHILSETEDRGLAVHQKTLRSCFHLHSMQRQ